MARMTAKRALAAARACASPLADERRLIALNESKPTAMTVSKIISESVTISAKPFAWINLMGFWVMDQGFYRREGCRKIDATLNSL
jgi:hypothetical protein